MRRFRRSCSVEKRFFWALLRGLFFLWLRTEQNVEPPSKISTSFVSDLCCWLQNTSGFSELSLCVVFYAFNNFKIQFQVCDGDKVILRPHPPNKDDGKNLILYLLRWGNFYFLFPVTWRGFILRRFSQLSTVVVHFVECPRPLAGAHSLSRVRKTQKNYQLFLSFQTLKLWLNATAPPIEQLGLARAQRGCAGNPSRKITGRMIKKRESYWSLKHHPR